MMTRKIWREVVIDCVTEIADRQKQVDLWLNGDDTQFSTPTEAYESLFSLADFEGFLTDENIGLSNAEVNTGRKFEKILDAYFEKTTPTPSSTEEVSTMIDDPEWEKVRQAAREFLNTLSEDTR